MSTQYQCGTDERSGMNERRDAVRAARRNGQPILNGIDFLEVVSADQRTLAVHLIHGLSAVASPPFTPTNVVISGGVRLRDIRVLSVTPSADDVLTVTVDQAGDFSQYTLQFVRDSDDSGPPRGFDAQLAAIAFTFKATCPSDFDCENDQPYPPEHLPAPEINYLAKDYASFRRLMLDRLAVLLPQWRERHAADVGIALVEVLAYVADRLSYEQDAIATEAYLGTARRRTSVRRHARLVDYIMHDGCNARTWVQIRVEEDVTAPPPLPRGTKLLTRTKGLPARIVSDEDYQTALAAGAEVFETMAPLPTLFVAHNDLHFYTWGARNCCLPKGATQATLRDHLPNLKAGDVLILQEARGPRTGEEEDADPAHCHAVRLIDVQHTDRDNNPLVDPLTEVLITEIAWHADDALPFPLCISATVSKEDGLHGFEDVGIALGNIVLVDHGRTLDKAEKLGTVPTSTLTRVGSTARGSAPIPPRFRPRLAQTPLTQAARDPYTDEGSELRSASAALQWDPATALPALTMLRSVLAEDTFEWKPLLDLLRGDPNTRGVVVEVEHDGTTTLRFGDGTHGERPKSNSAFEAIYRVGNGTHGNIGANMLAHIVTSVGKIERVTNPLPARGGMDAESAEQVRQRAPQAFRTQQRAVTPDDYAAIAQRHAGVQRAAATLRWTGSWHTVFLSVDQVGGAPVKDAFERDLRRFVEPFRMAGHDLEVDHPQLVPLEIELRVCVDPAYFRSSVRAALLNIFSNRTLPDGRRGVFHPDNFSFGQPVYLSHVYAAAETVPGVASATVTTFQRHQLPATSGLNGGELRFGRLEIASLDNDPNFPDRGVFRLIVEGGK